MKNTLILCAALALASATPISIVPRTRGTEANLFPVPGSPRWTTLAHGERALPLSNSTFRPFKVSDRCPFTYEDAPDGTLSLKAHYPKGSYKPSLDPCGGVTFYAPGPASVDLSTAREALFSYSVYFPSTFDYVKGGNLPGLYGGDDNTTSVTCSSGRKDSTCFSARLLWKEKGTGAIFLYLPRYDDPRFAVNGKLCSRANSICDETYGISVDMGSFSFPPGQWTTVAERIRLNDIDQANGEIELFVNGVSVISVTGIIIRDSSAGRIRGMQVQSFFGGSTSDWATPKDQDLYFANFGAEIISTEPVQ